MPTNAPPPVFDAHPSPRRLRRAGPVRFAALALLGFAGVYGLRSVAGEKAPAPNGEVLRFVPLPGPAPRPPVVALPPSARAEKPIEFTKALVEIDLAGPVARAAVTLTLHNPNGRVLEGELVFPLPEGCTVSGYGIDVAGEIVDAVPVPKVKARRVFEEEVRRNPTIDPGLVERVQGNVFRTRIHPLPARGLRLVKIEWVAPLAPGGENGDERVVPLAWGLKLPEVEIRLRVSGGLSITPSTSASAAGDGKKNNNSNAVFSPGDFAWTASKTFKDFTLDGGIVCAPPPTVSAGDAGLSAVEDWRDENGLTVGHYFALAVDGKGLAAAPAGDASAPMRWKRVAVAWDASLSRLEAFNAPDAAGGENVSGPRAREAALLSRLLESFAPEGGVAVDLYVFRDDAEPVRSFAAAPGAEQGRALVRALAELTYDGGTDFSALELPAAAGDGSAYDAMLVFTDGLATLNEALPKLPAGAWLLGRAERADHDRLAYLAGRAGGRYLNLDVLRDDDALAAFRGGKEPPRVHAVLSDPDAIDELHPPVGAPLPANAPLVLTGRLKAERATVRVVLCDGPYDPARAREVEFILERDKALAGGVVGRLWAQRKIAALSPLPDENADALESLGRDFGLVTPNSSLLVLENLEQHLRHDIAPPRSRAALHQQFMAQRAKKVDETASREADRLRAVKQLWEEKIRWYDSAFKKPSPAQIAANKNRPPAPVAPTPVPAAAPQPRAVALSSNAVDFDGRMAAINGAVASGSARPPATPAASLPGAALAGELREEDTAAASSDRRGGRMATERARRAVALEAAASPAISTAAGADASPALAGQPPMAEKSEIEAADGAPVLELKAWLPDAPYVAILRQAPADKLYDAYLIARPGFLRAPGFFLDCATLMLERGRPELAARVLGNVVELDLGEVPLLRAAAHKYAQIGRLDRAAALFGRVLRERPDEPQSRRDLALVLADRADALDDPASPEARALRREAVSLLHHVVMNGPYGRFDQIESIALMEANRIVARMPADEEFVNPFDESLRRNLDCDLRVVLSWDADDTDIDLWVVEPTGEQCGYSHPLTGIGGRLSRDFTQGYGPEEYALRRRAGGDFAVRANYYGSRQQRLQGPVTVQATVFVNWGRADEQRRSLTVRVAEQREWLDLGKIELTEK